MDVVPALATGNAVIQKADNQGALSILASRRAFIDAGVPAALWPVVTGPGSEIGEAVIDAVRRGLLHRLDADRQACRGTGRRQPDLRVARARRQEPDDRAG